jgi:hypothetical protein
MATVSSRRRRSKYASYFLVSVLIRLVILCRNVSTSFYDQALVGIVYCRGRQVVVRVWDLLRLFQHIGDSAIGRLNENIDSFVSIQISSFYYAHISLFQNVKKSVRRGAVSRRRLHGTVDIRQFATTVFKRLFTIE